MVEYRKGIKYKEFVELCRQEKYDEDEYLELHHIKPRFYAPELESEPSNMIYVSPENHYLLHVVLAYNWPKDGAVKAMNSMSHLLQYGIEYTDAEINRAASIHGAARRKAHDAQCEPQILITFPGMLFVKRFSSLKKAEEQMKETTNGFSISTVRNNLCPYRLLTEEEYFDCSRKPIRAFCTRTTVFATHNLHQTFKNISEAATCLGFTEQQICAAIELDEPLNEELNSWRFRYLY